jgi:hypothetical protein
MPASPPTETKSAIVDQIDSNVVEPTIHPIIEADLGGEIEPKRTIGSILTSIFIGTMFSASAVMAIFAAYGVWVLVQPQADLSRPSAIEQEEKSE